MYMGFEEIFLSFWDPFPVFIVLDKRAYHTCTHIQNTQKTMHRLV